ncbi:hypothetical protein AAC387_Pa02g4839 [Persea americana]
MPDLHNGYDERGRYVCAEILLDLDRLHVDEIGLIALELDELDLEHLDETGLTHLECNELIHLEDGLATCSLYIELSLA